MRLNGLLFTGQKAWQKIGPYKTEASAIMAGERKAGQGFTRFWLLVRVDEGEEMWDVQ